MEMARDRVSREEEGLGGELRRGFMRGRRCLDIKGERERRELPECEEERKRCPANNQKVHES